MNWIADWLRMEFQMQKVSFVEKQAHGLVFRGVSRDEEVMILVPASQKVWLRRVAHREWTPTGVAVPDRLML